MAIITCQREETTPWHRHYDHAADNPKRDAPRRHKSGTTAIFCVQNGTKLDYFQYERLFVNRRYDHEVGLCAHSVDCVRQCRPAATRVRLGSAKPGYVASRVSLHRSERNEQSARWCR